VIEPDARDARVGPRVEEREAGAREVGLGVVEGRRRTAAVVEQLALHPVRLLRAGKLARARVDREVGHAHVLPVLLDLDLDGVAGAVLVRDDGRDLRLEVLDLTVGDQDVVGRPAEDRAGVPRSEPLVRLREEALVGVREDAVAKRAERRIARRHGRGGLLLRGLRVRVRALDLGAGAEGLDRHLLQVALERRQRGLEILAREHPLRLGF
jgi:hypothetical protein